MSHKSAVEDLVGRDLLLEALGKLVDRVGGGERVSALVAGEAGIGKTSLLRAAASLAAERGVRTAWGTCLDIDGAPGYWPWTQALDGFVRAGGVDAVRATAGEDAALIASIVPSLGDAARGEATGRDRMLAMDATSRLLERLAEQGPLIVVLDDLQWADESSLELFGFVAGSPRSAALGLIGAYRETELSPAARRRLSPIASRGEHIYVEGLDVAAVRRLAERVIGERVEPDQAAALHRRTGGHPFFVRELLLLGGSSSGTPAERVPVAVRGAIDRRIAQLPEPTVEVLEVTAVDGLALRPDVVAAALGRPAVDVERAARPAIEAGMLTSTDNGARLVHDLLRETLLDRIDAGRRLQLHQSIGSALEARVQRGAQVAPADLARHFVAAVALDGPERAVRWALAAAASDGASLAFGEAAGHLRRLRSALVEAAAEIDDRTMVEVLIAEADALARAGAAIDARGLLRHAADVASRAGAPEQLARVALATAQLGARFATRRDDIVRQLDQALAAVAGADDALEARLTATLARELQHSVAEDRPRAGPFSERALEVGRRAGDPATLLDCLLARHDVLWVPGTGDQRSEIAREIVAVALAAGDEDRHAEGLLLLANSLLEQGSPAYEAALESCLTALENRGQPRHRYTALTRRACIALLRDRLDDATRLIDDAKELGERIREPDTGNVYMSQRLELVRARGSSEELAAFATEAVNHWTGAPIHAHAVAAGFYARAGDLDAARRHLVAVLDLGTWRADRSYLWSVFVGELAHAAIALDHRHVCDQLLEDLLPLTGSCGVNGAVVAFAGSHDHTAGLLAAAVGQSGLAERLLAQAKATYRRLGAVGWAASILDRRAAAPPMAGRQPASMVRRGAVWHLSFAGRATTVPHAKGLADIARLLAAPGTEIHVLELIDTSDRSGPAGPMVDRKAIASYRRRLAELDAEVDDAGRDNDLERHARSEAERQALLDEVVRVTGTRGQARQFANHPAERARKAVTARVRDAIARLDPLLPELAAHLDRAIVTGTYCRYRSDSTVWHVDSGG